MQIKMRYILPILACLGGGQALAQGTPLSVIDWLDTQSVLQPEPTPPNEPDVAKSGAVSEVTVAPLGGPSIQTVGLVPSTVTGLPATLWQGQQGSILARQLAAMPTQRLPAAQSLFYTILLAETHSPSGQAGMFQLARVDALMRQAALEPALALLEQIGPETNAATMAHYFEASLLNETEDPACKTILETPQLVPNYAARVFCTARAGDWGTAVLLLGIARALDVIPTAHVDALERFLDPDLFEDAAPLPRLDKPDALMFRVYEALGQPLSTRTWPSVYANADLRDVAGWKSQLEAAERLAATGALPDNRLLGIYSARRPAASGGIWDRVAAVQRLDTALRIKSAEAVSKTLPDAWRQMKAAGLAVPLATLFSDALEGFELTPNAQDLAFKIALLSANYEQVYAPQEGANAFLLGLAKGAPPVGTTDTERAISKAFARDGITKELQLALDDKTVALGGILLKILVNLQAGAEGDLAQLTSALGNLRALGLEDTARRAALQLLILGPVS